MTAIAIPVKSEDEWHALRAKTIGSSEIAALFNVSPYTTKFELWHAKAGNIPPSSPDHERIKWGERLEPAIAGGIAEDRGWLIRKVRRYLLAEHLSGMGASLDYEVINHPDGAGCLEVKNVDFIIWRDSWVTDRDGEEAPIHIELQLQHQLAVTGRTWGAIGVLVGGNDPHVIVRQRHDATIKKIEREVAAFWKSIKDKREPEVGVDDYAAVKALYPEAREMAEPLDLTADKNLAVQCGWYIDAAEREKKAKADKEAVAAQILHTITDAPVAKTLGFIIKAPTIRRRAYEVAESSYRRVTVRETT